MSDALKAILTNVPLWSALISAIVYFVVLRDPSFPRPAIDVLVSVVIALLSALGVTGVQGVVPAVRQAQAERAINAAIANRSVTQKRTPPNSASMPAGLKAFFAYRTAVGSKTYDGKEIPMWDDLSESVKRGWAAAEAAARRLNTPE